MKYRQKPIEIEAWRWDGEELDDSVPDWIFQEMMKGKLFITMGWKGQTYITISKKQGQLRLYPGDYIIKGCMGGIYSCKPDTFLQSHEAI